MSSCRAQGRSDEAMSTHTGGPQTPGEQRGSQKRKDMDHEKRKRQAVQENNQKRSQTTQQHQQQSLPQRQRQAKQKEQRQLEQQLLQRAHPQQQQQPQKKSCCSPCCRKERRHMTDSEAEDDASHIASLSHQSVGTKKTSCCFGNVPAGDTGPDSRRGSNCKKCCKKFLAFVFSHVGLYSLVVAYSIMGGFLFQWLEASDEIQQRIGVSKKRNSSIYKLWNLTRKLNILHERNWTILADQVLREFQTEVYQSIKEGGWDGRDETSEETQWSFAGSLLYSVTVITTIGYGHIAPKTDMGRLVTMFYALVGIPLTLLCLSNIGSFFANCFRFLYKHICQCLVWLCCRRKQRGKRPRDELARQALRRCGDISTQEKGLHLGNGRRDAGHDAAISREEPKLPLKEEIRVPMVVSLIIIAGYIFGGAVLFSLWEEDWNYLIGSYFCFVTLSTIGFGDYVFGVGSDLANNEKMIICAVYLVLGLSIIAMCFNLMQEEVRAKSRWLGAKLGIIEPKDKAVRRA